jgi:hypothetical protein
VTTARKEPTVGSTTATPRLLDAERAEFLALTKGADSVGPNLVEPFFSRHLQSTAG